MNAETQKAVLAALLTSLVKKIETPTQDVRLHKIEMSGGYSGRSYDTHHVTGFLKNQPGLRRLAMKSGSGWLTRSIEQNHPFNRQFPGKIQNAKVKEAFLYILEDIEERGADAEAYLHFAFQLLDRQVRSSNVALAPVNPVQHISIEQIVAAVSEHFFAPYTGAGASRLPVLAIYALYASVMERHPRYIGATLLPLKSHTTSDARSESIGDVEIAGPEGGVLRGGRGEAWDRHHACPGGRCTG